MPTELDRPYCSVADVQDETANNRPEDIELFKRSINRASREIDDYCRRDFLYRDHRTEAFVVPAHYCAENVIYLPWPVLSVSAIEIAFLGVAPVVIAPSEYAIENPIQSATGKIFKATNWRTPSYSPLMQIRLKGTFGYLPATKDAEYVYTEPAPGLPQSIRQACTTLAGIRSGKHRREFVDPSGQRQSVTVRTIPKEIAEMLCRFRLGIVP